MKKKIMSLALCGILAIAGCLSTAGMSSGVVQAEEQIELQDNLVNYLVVDKPTLSSGETQQIVIGIGNSEKTLEEAILWYENVTTGEQYMAAAYNSTSDSLEFRIELDGYSDGVYEVTNFIYNLDGETYNLSLPDAGLDGRWGVGVEVETNNDAIVATGQEDDNCDEDANYTVKTSDSSYETDDISDAISSALEEQQETAQEQGRASNGNLVIVLDPGHGGDDGGASNKTYGVLEKDVNLTVAKVVQAELNKYEGVSVFMTRSDDTYVSLSDRAAIGKFWNADIFIGIHFNSGAKSAHGAEVYYPNANYNVYCCLIGAGVAENIQRNLVALGIYDRGIKIKNSESGATYPDGSVSDYYSLICNPKKSGIPAIIVEHEFISNDDVAWNIVNNPLYLLAIGMADAKGIVEAYGLHTKEHWKATGLYLQNHSCDNFTVGMVVENKNVNLDYRWLVYDYSTGLWGVASDWKTNNEWLSWNPGKTGDYLIQGEVRATDNQTDTATYTLGSPHHQHIQEICQLPNPYGSGYLLGEETQYSSPYYLYEIMILDCNKLAAGDPNPWVYSTGMTTADKVLWTTWNPQYGYYWTLYRVYDSYGRVIDEMCYGFVNAY